MVSEIWYVEGRNSFSRKSGKSGRYLEDIGPNKFSLLTRLIYGFFFKVLFWRDFIRNIPSFVSFD